MIVTQFLYESYEQLYVKLCHIDKTKPSLIQIFTNALLPNEAVALAQKAQAFCPHAKIIGTSVSGVIYQGEQYDNHTLIVVEQYENTEIATHVVCLENYILFQKKFLLFLMTNKRWLMVLFFAHFTMNNLWSMVVLILLMKPLEKLTQSQMQKIVLF